MELQRNLQGCTKLIMFCRLQPRLAMFEPANILDMVVEADAR